MATFMVKRGTQPIKKEFKLSIALSVSSDRREIKSYY